MPEEEIVVPLEDVTASDTDGDGAPTTGGEVEENTQPSDQPTTDGLTTQPPPATTVDNTDDIQPLSYDGLDSNDRNDLPDTTSLDDSSGTLTCQPNRKNQKLVLATSKTKSLIVK